MSSYKICIFLFVIYGYRANGKVCPEDCILLSHCPDAVDLITNDPRTTNNQRLLQDSLCGFEYVAGRSPKVCCSDFVAPEKDEIETHPNIDLLPDSCGAIDARRILGGTVATLYEFPWMALISYHTSKGLDFLCSGSVINSRYVLTAAHCVQGKNIAGVRIGEYDIRYITDCQEDHQQIVCESHIQDVLVEEQIIQEHYHGPPAVVNDIALLRLKESIDFSFKNAGPICLPISAQSRNLSTANQRGSLAGWTRLQNGVNSSVLYKVDVAIQSTESCLNFLNNNLMNNYMNKNDICARGLHKDSCDINSGSPLMLEEEYKGDFRIVQYGIVSRGPKECGSKYPEIYTNVAKLMKWILDNIKP